MKEDPRVLDHLVSNKFLILSSDTKVPTHSFESPKRYDDVKDLPDLGIIVTEPYVVFDFDNPVEYNIIKEILENSNLKYRMMKSSRGGHVWFKSAKPITNHVGIRTALTIETDIKSYGKASQVKVKDGGKWRVWEHWDDDIDFVPAWLTPINHNIDFLGAKIGNRNDELFKYIITLVNNGISRDDIRITFGLINDYLFKDKLSDEELNIITRDGAFANIRPAFYTGRSFHHDKFAQFFKNENHVYSLAGNLYMYNDGYYSNQTSDMERRMIMYISELNRSNRREVIDYLGLIADQPKEKSPYHIVCQNGLIDIRQGDLLPFSPDVFVTNKVNARYDAIAYDKHVDETLNKLCCNDIEVRKLLEEMIGYCLIPTAKFQKSFILTGAGSNGKSTFLDMLIEFIGKGNVSSLSLKDLNHNFRVAEITSKLANIGDDISDEYMEDSSSFKKLVTGEDITVEKKNESPYILRNTAKLIFAANSLPMSLDKSNGMNRRLCLIPFNAKFSTNDEDYDPFIIDKLTSDNARSYLLRLAIAGVQRLFTNNKFTEPLVVDRLINEFVIENNNVLQFMQENTHGGNIEGVIANDLYDDYIWWCSNAKIQPYKKNKFQREVRTNTEFDTKIANIDGKAVQRWERV